MGVMCLPVAGEGEHYKPSYMESSYMPSSQQMLFANSCYFLSSRSLPPLAKWVTAVQTHISKIMSPLDSHRACLQVADRCAMINASAFDNLENLH